MGTLDNLSEGFSRGWDDARKSRRTGGAEGLAPEAFLGRDVGALDQPGPRAEYMGKRLAAEKFLAMEAHCKVFGITPDYGEE